MKLPRRTFLHLAAGAAALSALSCIAKAQSYPSRPVRIIVATGTPALSRRAMTRRERPPCAVGTEAKSCSELGAEEVPLLILDSVGGSNCHHGCDEQMFGGE